MLFQRFIRKHIPGLRVLPASMEQYLPGVILDPEKMRLLGHCRDLLPDEPESSWTYTRSEANMIYGTIAMDRKLSSRVNVLGVFSIGGGFSHDLRVHIEIREMIGASLDMHQLILQPKLNELRRIDRRGRWRLVNNRFVALETFYASEFRATFFRKNQRITKAELEKMSHVNVSGEIEYLWETDKSLIITKNDKVPFGVRGFTV